MFAKIHTRENGTSSTGKRMMAYSNNFEISCITCDNSTTFSITFTEIDGSYPGGKYDQDSLNYKEMQRDAVVEMSCQELNKIITYAQEQGLLSVLINNKVEG